MPRARGGAMTALRLIPHKSWNVHSAKNRKRSLEAREEAERKEKEAKEQEHGWELETMRRRVGGTTTTHVGASETCEQDGRKDACEGVPLANACTKSTPWYVREGRDLATPDVGRSEPKEKSQKQGKRTRKTLEEMRRERMEREAKEAERAKRLLRGTSSAEPEGGKRYHAAYGHAAKRRR